MIAEEDDGVAEDLADSSTDAHVGDNEQDPEVAPGCVSPEVRPVAWVNPHPDRGEELPFGLVVLKGPEDFRNILGTEPPQDVRFPDEWAVFVMGDSQRPESYSIDSLEPCAENTVAELTSHSWDSCSYPQPFFQGGGLWAFPAVEAMVNTEFFDLSGRSGTSISCPDNGVSLGEPCGNGVLCAPEGVCAGLTENPVGICTPVDHVGSAETAYATEIPDGDAGGVEIVNDVGGVSGVVADVVVEAVIDHPSARDAVLSLISPAGTDVVVWDREHDWFPNGLFRAAWGFAGEQPNGQWTLKVVDDVLGNSGEVDRWTISIVTVPE